jgi:hypothetical protein
MCTVKNDLVEVYPYPYQHTPLPLLHPMESASSVGYPVGNRNSAPSKRTCGLRRAAEKHVVWNVQEAVSTENADAQAVLDRV